MVAWLCRCCRRSVNKMHGHTRIMLGLSFLSSVSKHNIWWYYGLVCCCFCPLVNTMWSYYGWICRCCCCPSVNTTCGRIMVGFVVVVRQ
jgi:hypothetical protein